MAEWHLAQINASTALVPLDYPQIEEFMRRLDEINALAEQSPGFVWRLKSDDGNATSIQLTDDPLFLINMSVWENAQASFDYVYTSTHKELMAKRRQWFAKPVKAPLALWWIKAGQVPTAKEGLARLDHLNRHGPTAHAFTFKQRFPHPAAA